MGRCAGGLTQSCFPECGPELTVGLRPWAQCPCWPDAPAGPDANQPSSWRTGSWWPMVWGVGRLHSPLCAQLATGSRLWRRLWGWRPGRAKPMGAQALGGPPQGWGGWCISFPVAILVAEALGAGRGFWACVDAWCEATAP